MLRQGIWLAIILTVFSVLPACAHKEIARDQESLAPKSGIVGGQASLEPKSGIVGRWEALEPKSGLVNILDIQPDGKMKSSLLARVHMRYHIAGDKVILIPEDTSEKSKPTTTSDAVEKPLEKSQQSADKEAGQAKIEAKQEDQSKGPEPVIYSFVLETDRLKMTHDASGEVMDMQREDRATAPDSIVGRWSYKHPMGETARMIFDANGNNIMRVPLPGGMDVYYQVNGDVITATDVDKKHTQTVNYKLEDGKLALITGQKTAYYIRFVEPK